MPLAVVKQHNMMHYLYSCMLYLFLPLLFIRLWFKQFKSRDYQKYSQQGRWKERLGFAPEKLINSRPIWIHAVSVGEFIAVRPLIQLLQKKHPDIPLLITSTTLTGSEQILNAFANNILHMYIPWDLPGAMQRFYSSIKPRAALIMETEIWPNLLFEAQKKDIPVFLINARMSEKSANSYQHINRFTHSMMKCFEHICVQSDADQQRFISLGCNKDQLSMTGNIKFDLNIKTSLVNKAAELKQQLLWQEQEVLLASSTHSGEDELFLNLFWQLRKTHPKLKLILVARHPERFKQVELLARKEQADKKTFSVVTRSKIKSIQHQDSDILIGDSLGEMILYYSLSDIVLMGGTFISHGGHNILEPAALAKPIFYGPSMYNFSTINNLFLSRHASVQVNHIDELMDTLSKYMEDKNRLEQLANRAKKLIKENSGSKEKIYKKLNQYNIFN
jgi:3-deoxy-D-manno-octulosonic-acid transferase